MVPASKPVATASSRAAQRCLWMCRWVWVSLGALVAANLLFHSVLMLAATYLRPIRRRPNAQSEEALALREYAKHGGPSGRPVILGLAEVPPPPPTKSCPS